MIGVDHYRRAGSGEALDRVRRVMPDSPQRLTSPRRTASASVNRSRASGPAVGRTHREHQSPFVELVRQLQRELGEIQREFGHQVTRRLPSA